MRTAICHYSFNRTWTAEQWSCVELVRAVEAHGVEGIDFHAGLLGDPDTAVERVRTALQRTGLVLAAMALSNDFNQEDAAEHRKQVGAVIGWVRRAAQLRAPVARIFGGHLHDPVDPAARKAGFQRVVDALGQVAAAAAGCGVVLALENHGGLPCTGEEQVRMIETIGSPHLRATVDVGNYLLCGQAGHDGTAAAARHAAYVHLKDYRRGTGDSGPLEACTPGEGDVDHARCLRALQSAGYRGFVALEYEGSGDERQGVRDGVAFMKKAMGAPAQHGS